MEALMDFNQANPLTKSSHLLPEPTLQLSVSKNRFLFQVDAGCFQDDVYSFGCIIRDNNNGIILSACNRNQGRIKPYLTELLVVRWGLQLAKDLLFENFTLQSNALFIFDCINQIQHFASLYHIVIDHRLLFESFKDTIVMFVSKILICDVVYRYFWQTSASLQRWLLAGSTSKS